MAPERSHTTSGRGRAGIRAAAALLWLVAWQAVAGLVGSDLLLPGPVETVAALARLCVTAEFWRVVACSTLAIVGGFLVAFTLGCALGALAAQRPAVDVLLEPAVSALKTVPVACVVVVLLLWVGTGGVTWACVFLVAFPAFYASMRGAVRSLDRGRLDALRLMGVGSVRRALAAGWPGVAPGLAVTAASAVGMSWKAGVAAELIGLVDGTLGERVYQAKLLLETSDLFAWTVVVVLLAWLAERTFRALLAWSGRATGRLAVRLAPRERAVAPGSVGLARASAGHGGDVTWQGVDLTLAPGERAVLSAASGAGKTTLVDALCGRVPLLAGSRDVPELVSVVWQAPSLVEGLTAEENLRLVAPRALWPQADALVRSLVGEDAAGRPAATLSGGQARRVEVARALVAPTSAVLLDEPFAGLDEESHEAAAGAVLGHLAGRPLLVASHDQEDVSLLDASVVRLPGPA